MRSPGPWLRRCAESVAAAMLAVMFLAFVVQIVFRYLLNFPVGWTSELTVILWLWLVLWGAAFVVKESEEIRFDLISSSVGRRARIAMGVVASIALVILYAASLPAAWKYVAFMKVEKTAYLKIPFNWLFSIFIVFAVAVIARYLWILFSYSKGQTPEEADPAKTGSGL